MKKVLLTIVLLAIFIGCEKSEMTSALLPEENIELKSANIKLINVPEDYPTIQEAVNHAEKGTTIHVSGTFAEYIRIENLDGIKLVGENAILKLPNLGYYSRMVKIINCANFEVSGFTFDCDFGQMSSIDPTLRNILSGILTSNSSGKICNNHFKNFYACLMPDAAFCVLELQNDEVKREISICNNKIENFNFYGIASWGNSFLKIDGNDIICSQVNKYTKSSCINPMGGNAIITNNTIYGCPNPADVHEPFGDFWWGMIGLDMNDTKNVLISKNIIKNCNPAIGFANWAQEDALNSIKVLNTEFINNTLNFTFYNCSEDDILFVKNTFN